MTREGGQPPHTPWSFRFTAEPKLVPCRHYACDANDLIGHTGCYILELGSDIGLSVFERAWTPRSMENLLIDMIEEPEGAEAI
jgi:hypothetical protein